MNQETRNAIAQIRAGIRINITSKTQFGEWSELIKTLSLALDQGGIQHVQTVYSAIRNVEPALNDDNESPYPYEVNIDDNGLKAIDKLPYDGDIGLADSIAYLFKNHLRYVPGIGWLIWTGKRWIQDPSNAIYQYAIITVRARQNAVNARQIDGADENQRNQKNKDYAQAVHGEKRKRIQDAIAIAQTLPNVVIASTMLDDYDNLLTVANGTVDLNTGELLAPSPIQYQTKLSNIPYYSNAQCPRWEQFISEIFGGNDELIRYIQKVCGYALTGYTTEQSFWILYGMGSNGKSTFLNVMLQITGEYGSNAPFNTFADGKNTTAGDDVARLRGQRLVMASEAGDGEHLNEARVKSVTGGDIITARFLYGKYFEFKPKFKVLLAVNHKPIIRGNDRGIWRRVKLIPFTVSFERNADKALETKLMNELPGILAWAVRGAVLWKREGMQTPAIVIEATESYQTEMDIIGNFLEENTTLNSVLRTKSSDIYNSYQLWAEDNGLRSLSNPKFSKAMIERGFRKERFNNGMHWMGLGLNSEGSE